MSTGLSHYDRYVREVDRDTAARKKRQSMGGPLDTLSTDNLDGVWVVKEIDLLGTEFLFRHNLGATTNRTGSKYPNVSWLSIFRHDGTGLSVALGLEYFEGDTISANEIGLRLTGAGRTVSADHPVTVAAFFQKAEAPW